MDAYLSVKIISLFPTPFYVFVSRTEKNDYGSLAYLKHILNKNLKYLITDTNGKILKNSYDLKILLNKVDWKKI